tara:strand:+ start:41 stop:913 length:873 start_codon:yes stop_codon:yes gene_type:complete
LVGYSKLEVKGEWNSNSDQPTEVLVAFGSISLNIFNSKGEPLRQWAYSSIFLKNRGTSKSMFCPDMEETESLYIFDQDAVNYLTFLCNKTNRKKFANLLPWIFIIILLIGFSTFFPSYFRIATEKIALSITSAEQEINLGNIMFNEILGVSYCDVDKTNEYIRSLDKDFLSGTGNVMELIFINFKTNNSILFPGRKLLVPYSILENEDGASALAETTKLALAATKNKKAIENFFSKQRNKALLIYIFGFFTDLNFNKDNGLLISLHGKSKVLDKGLTNSEWFTLKKLCKL